MNQEKENLISRFQRMRNNYSNVLLKGIAFREKDRLYPVRMICQPINSREERFPKQTLDYEYFVLIQDYLQLNEFEKFLGLIGESTELKLSSASLEIPKGYFREENENSSEITANFGGYSSLGETERRLLQEQRSYPKSSHLAWPSQVYIFKMYPPNEVTNSSYHLQSRPFPLREGLPVLPSYDSALSFWLGKGSFFVPDWDMIFLFPDYRARITKVRMSGRIILISAESGVPSPSTMGGKYYLEYENRESEAGDVDFTEEGIAKVPISDTPNQFYFSLFEKEYPEEQLDYRNYRWGRYYEGDIDVEFEEDLEFLLSQGEGDTLEFKLDVSTESSKEEFLETVCSFSNTYGGRILLGVDDRANVKGIEDPQRLTQKISDLIYQWIEPKPGFKITTVAFGDKSVLIVSVDNGRSKPYGYKQRGYYIRAGSTDRIPAHYELLFLIESHALRTRI